MLLRGRIRSVVSKRLYIVSSRVQGRCLRSSTLPSLALVFADVTRIALSLFGAHSDHSVFIRRTKSGIVVLVVYVDDILLTDNDPRGLLETKEYLKRHFVTKDMVRPIYFLGIEIAHKNIAYFFLNKSMLWIF